MAFSTTIQGSIVRPGEIDYTITLLEAPGNSGAMQFDECDTITLEIDGTWGAAGAVAVQCSNGGSNFYALPTAVSRTADGVATVPLDGLGFRNYRLALTGGDATTSLTVRVVGQRNARARG